jgi:hypothetical protein
MNSSAMIAGSRNFLVKVNSDAAPGGIGVPTEASQWEGRTFSTEPPRKSIKQRGIPKRNLPPEQAADPRPGDRLFIWINKDGGGRGLTATADVATISRTNSRRSIQPINVRLYTPLGVINDTHLDGFPASVFKDIQRSRLKTLRYIRDEDAREIDEAVQRHSISDIVPRSDIVTHESPPPPAPPPPSPPPDDPESVAAGRQAQMSLIEQRANQGPFRDAVMARDGGRCVVTGCRVAEVLEAAHLIPYASGHYERDNPSNGVLLRADVHTLFDRDLLAIDPQTMELWVSDQLQDTAYARLAHKKIRTAAGLPYLRYQYEAATARA